MKTVKVRIAVAVDADGVWKAIGYSGARHERDMIAFAQDAVGDVAANYWVTAELLIPEPQVVQGKVEEE